jgi:hypothetical protein
MSQAELGFQLDILTSHNELSRNEPSRLDIHPYRQQRGT